jgi:hypothetical protein
MTPEQRRLRAQLAANTRWSRPMSREDQADAARTAMHERLMRQVDPLGNCHQTSATAGSAPQRGHCRRN